MTNKALMVLQNYTNLGNAVPGVCAETCTSHDASQAMNIKAEEVSDADETEDPLQITVPKIKAEPEVSCMSLYVHCWADITDMQNCKLCFFSPSLSAHESTLHWILKSSF
jgi:hypothetical protein